MSIPKVSKEMPVFLVDRVRDAVKGIPIALGVNDLVESPECPIVNASVHTVCQCARVDFHKAVIDQCSHCVLEIDQVNSRVEKPFRRVIADARTKQIIPNVLVVEVSQQFQQLCRIGIVILQSSV